MKIVVNDANILIDLVELELLPAFFQLEFEFHTTALVLDELFEYQQRELTPYIKAGKLYVAKLSWQEIAEILKISTAKPSLSEQDCSAFYQAKEAGAILLTSDNTLRKFARSMAIEVHGHLWIFDCLVGGKVLSGIQAVEKLKELCEVVNPKLGLPEQECEKRIRLWAK